MIQAKEAVVFRGRQEGIVRVCLDFLDKRGIVLEEVRVGLMQAVIDIRANISRVGLATPLFDLSEVNLDRILGEVLKKLEISLEDAQKLRSIIRLVWSRD